MTEEHATERTRRVLRERAKVLSQPLEHARTASTLELVVFSVGDERYGVELEWAREVMALPEIVPAPHTPAWLPGVMGYRGRVLAVVDLGRFLALPGTAEQGSKRLLVLEPPGVAFGLLIDALHGVVYTESELAHSPAGGEGKGRLTFVKQIASGGIAVLDVLELAQHPSFQVNG